MTSSYIDGFPIFKFMSVEEYENNREVIESSINLEKEKIGDEKEEEKEGEPQPSDVDNDDALPPGVFTYNIETFGSRNGYIPGK